MKKALLVLIILLSGSQLKAQFSLGLKGGLNYCNIIDNTDSENFDYRVEGDFKLSYHFGLTSNYSISNKWSIGTELLLSDKGFKSESGTVNFLYVNIPILANYSITEKLRIHAGPELGFRLSAMGKGDGYSNDVSIFFNKSFDLGAAVGLDYLLTENFLITGRYIRGLLTNMDGIIISNNGVDRNNVTSKVFNNSFQLSLTYLLLNR